MRRSLLYLGIFVFLFSSLAFATGTSSVLSGGVVTLSSLTTNWRATTDPNILGMLEVTNIQFNPSAIGDRLIIRNAGVGKIFDSKEVPINQAYHKNYIPPKVCDPSITIADCTISDSDLADVMISYVRVR